MFQEIIFNRPQWNSNTVFANSDTHVGPVAITILKYMQDAIVHLKDDDTYKIISEEKVLLEDSVLYSTSNNRLHTYHIVLPKMAGDYVANKLKSPASDSFEYFCLLYKLHKNPATTRPVCSDCTSTHMLWDSG